MNRKTLQTTLYALLACFGAGAAAQEGGCTEDESNGLYKCTLPYIAVLDRAIFSSDGGESFDAAVGEGVFTTFLESAVKDFGKSDEGFTLTSGEVAATRSPDGILAFDPDTSTRERDYLINFSSANRLLELDRSTKNFFRSDVGLQNPNINWSEPLSPVLQDTQITLPSSDNFLESLGEDTPEMLAAESPLMRRFVSGNPSFADIPLERVFDIEGNALSVADDLSAATAVELAGALGGLAVERPPVSRELEIELGFAGPQEASRAEGLLGEYLERNDIAGTSTTADESVELTVTSDDAARISSYISRFEPFFSSPAADFLTGLVPMCSSGLVTGTLTLEVPTSLRDDDFRLTVEEIESRLSAELGYGRAEVGRFELDIDKPKSVFGNLDKPISTKSGFRADAPSGTARIAHTGGLRSQTASAQHALTIGVPDTAGRYGQVSSASLPYKDHYVGKTPGEQHGRTIVEIIGRDEQVLLTRVCKEDGNCDYFTVLLGLCKLLQHQVGEAATLKESKEKLARLVLNLSWGVTLDAEDRPALLEQLLSEAAQQGVSIVAAAGEHIKDQSGTCVEEPGWHYPAAFAIPGLFPVAAVDNKGRKPKCSISNDSGLSPSTQRSLTGCPLEGRFPEFSARADASSFAAPQLAALLAQKKDEKPNASHKVWCDAVLESTSAGPDGMRIFRPD